VLEVGIKLWTRLEIQRSIFYRRGPEGPERRVNMEIKPETTTALGGQTGPSDQWYQGPIFAGTDGRVIAKDKNVSKSSVQNHCWRWE
jgi:hypothetical protein